MWRGSLSRFSTQAAPFPQSSPSFHSSRHIVHRQTASLSLAMDYRLWTMDSSLLPEADEFVQVGKRRQVGHAVEEDFAGEVVALVLDDAGEEALGVKLEALPLRVEGFHVHPLGSGNLPAHVVDAQAAFPVGHQLLLGGNDARVQEDRERDG